MFDCCGCIYGVEPASKRKCSTGGTNTAFPGCPVAYLAHDSSSYGNPLCFGNWGARPRGVTGKEKQLNGAPHWCHEFGLLLQGGLLFLKWDFVVFVIKGSWKSTSAELINIVLYSKLWHPFDLRSPDCGVFWSPAFSFLGQCWQLGWDVHKKKPINKIKLHLQFNGDAAPLGTYLMPNLNGLNTVQKFTVTSHSPIYSSKN